MDITPQTSLLHKVQINITSGSKTNITIENIVNENDVSKKTLFNRLKSINLEDKRKRSARRRISKARKDRVKQNIDFEGIEIFRIGLTHLQVTVIRDEDEIEVRLSSIVCNTKLIFPLCRWKKLEGFIEEITEALNTNTNHEEFEKRHVGGGLYVEADSGILISYKLHQ